MKRKIKGRFRKSSRQSSRSRSKFVAPRTGEDFFARPEQFQDEWNRINHVISRMRADGVSLRQAAREFEISPRKVIRLAGSALRKRANGRYAARAQDTRLRVMVVLTPEGLQEIVLRDSQQASRLAEYWDAVQRYVQRGDDSALRKFRGQHITDGSGEKILLLTAVAELDLQANAGNLSFESLYARAS